MDCQSKLKCAVCSIGYEKSYWSKSERDHHLGNRNTKLVCKTCRKNGYIPDDIKTYTCQECKAQKGMKFFDAGLIHHHKMHMRAKLLCKLCKASQSEKIKELEQRLKQSKRRCTCKKLIHDERCSLSPCFHGDVRWPGSDSTGVKGERWLSVEQRIFLDNLTPQPEWWRKAWRKE